MRAHNINVRIKNRETVHDNDFIICAQDLGEVAAALEKEYEAGSYIPAQGDRTPISLVRYTCEKNGWPWAMFHFDRYLDFTEYER